MLGVIIISMLQSIIDGEGNSLEGNLDACWNCTAEHPHLSKLLGEVMLELYTWHSTCDLLDGCADHNWLSSMVALWCLLLLVTCMQQARLPYEVSPITELAVESLHKPVHKGLRHDLVVLVAVTKGASSLQWLEVLHDPWQSANLNLWTLLLLDNNGADRMLKHVIFPDIRWEDRQGISCGGVILKQPPKLGLHTKITVGEETWLNESTVGIMI